MITSTAVQAIAIGSGVIFWLLAKATKDDHWLYLFYLAAGMAMGVMLGRSLPS